MTPSFQIPTNARREVEQARRYIHDKWGYEDNRWREDVQKQLDSGWSVEDIHEDMAEQIEEWSRMPESVRWEHVHILTNAIFLHLQQGKQPWPIIHRQDIFELVREACGERREPPLPPEPLPSDYLPSADALCRKVEQGITSRLKRCSLSCEVLAGEHALGGLKHFNNVYSSYKKDIKLSDDLGLTDITITAIDQGIRWQLTYRACISERCCSGFEKCIYHMTHILFLLIKETHSGAPLVDVIRGRSGDLTGALQYPLLDDDGSWSATVPDGAAEHEIVFRGEGVSFIDPAMVKSFAEAASVVFTSVQTRHDSLRTQFRNAFWGLCDIQRLRSGSICYLALFSLTESCVTALIEEGSGTQESSREYFRRRVRDDLKLSGVALNRWEDMCDLRNKVAHQMQFQVRMDSLLRIWQLAWNALHKLLFVAINGKTKGHGLLMKDELSCFWDMVLTGKYQPRPRAGIFKRKKPE